MAVCLLPGTELAFDEEVQYDRAFKFLGKGRVNHKVASFREVDVDDPYVHHDALEFPNGQVLKITQLVPGQTATVLQLPVTAHHDHHKGKFVARACDSRLVLNRTGAGLMASQGTVMLWEAVRNTAVDFSTGLVESFRRLTTPKQPASAVFADLDGEETTTNFATGIVPTPPKSPAAPKPERAAV
jgi:hypothetical protein